jgi:CelD/BcsL family acetyltransferase involved in cellulose biosynthesis
MGARTARRRCTGADDVSAAPFTVEVARTLADVERLGPVWNDIPWAGEQAEHAYFVAAARARAAAGRPFAVLVSSDGRPAAAAAGRVETLRLDTRVGYLRVYAPAVRMLQIVPGGAVAADVESIPTLVGAVRSVLAAGEADALALPALPVDSEVFAAFAALAGPLERQRFVPAWTRLRLVLPASFEEFLRSRSRKIRAGIRYDTKKLLEALGDELSVRIASDASSFDEVVRDLDRVSASTYQRALGAGFADTEERRALLRVSLEHGWARVYVLRRGEEPIAYWLCSVHRDRITLSNTGYLPEYAPYRVGIYLLMRVIENACDDPALRVLDFGPGRSAYKRHFSSEGYEERNLTVFAPTSRARRINATRTAVLGPAWIARKALDRTGLTDRVKAAWRARLRTQR